MNTKLKIVAVAGMVVVSLTALAGATFAKQGDDGTRPGWGWGDKNHVHTGPPGGPSVHPSQN